MCDNQSISSARQLYRGAPLALNVTYLVCGVIIVCVSLALYLEMFVFIMRTFKLKDRRTRTLWILALYPVYSLCGVVGVMVPRSSTVVDLVMDVFLVSCLYQFLMLLEDYLGSADLALNKVKDTEVRVNTPPVCCCCICLPKVKVNGKYVRVVRVMVLQTAVIRPMLSFITAVMWAEGVYTPGQVSTTNGYIYIIIPNLISSLTAVWGLFLIRRGFHVLLTPYRPAGKFMAIQFVILITLVPSLIINVLVTSGVIPCSQYLPSASRGDRLYHIVLVLLMIPLQMVARWFYRQAVDGINRAADAENDPESATKSIDSKLPEHGNAAVVTKYKHSTTTVVYHHDALPSTQEQEVRMSYPSTKSEEMNNTS